MSLFDRLSQLTTRQLFLIDGTGALISTVFLGIVLVYHQDLVGMPIEVLNLLALLAMLFSVYSFTCYVVQASINFLKAIAIVNLAYSIITTIMMVRYLEVLTMLGLAYFVIEVLIIITLVNIEWKHGKSS